jgi:hypothetical protein
VQTAGVSPAGVDGRGQGLAGHRVQWAGGGVQDRATAFCSTGGRGLRGPRAAVDGAVGGGVRHTPTLAAPCPAEPFGLE